MALDGAHRVQSNESICAWECGQEFFRVQCGCVNCSTQGLACPPGQRWQECSERADAGCTAFGICNYVELIDTIFTDVEGVD